MALTIKDNLIIGDVDKDGDVEIVMENSYDDNISMYIDQNQIKQIIEFLQAQLK
jgi:hypothetical protein